MHESIILSVAALNVGSYVYKQSHTSLVCKHNKYLCSNANKLCYYSLFNSKPASFFHSLSQFLQHLAIRLVRGKVDAIEASVCLR